MKVKKEPKFTNKSKRKLKKLDKIIKMIVAEGERLNKEFEKAFEKDMKKILK